MCMLMWTTGTTPWSWKQSSTVLLHKKGNELDLGNYRPMAVADTVYKLWTGVVHASMSTYAENFDILSSQQEDFRNSRNTIRQLQNMMNVLSDAKINAQDLYGMYIDFSSAFNTSDHDYCAPYMTCSPQMMYKGRMNCLHGQRQKSSCHMHTRNPNIPAGATYKGTHFCSRLSFSHG